MMFGLDANQKESQPMPKLVQDVEAFFSGTVTAIETELEADWAELKPAAVALGKTIEADVLTAAQVCVTSGGNFAAALGSVTSQIPSLTASVEAAIGGMLALKIASVKAATPAAPAPAA